MGWRRGPRSEERRRMTRTGERLYALGTASQVRKALKGKPGFKQCCTVERGIVMIIHTLHCRTRFPKYAGKLFGRLGYARMARDNYVPKKKHDRYHYWLLPVEYQA